MKRILLDSKINMVELSNRTVYMAKTELIKDNFGLKDEVKAIKEKF